MHHKPGRLQKKQQQLRARSALAAQTGVIHSLHQRRAGCPQLGNLLASEHTQARDNRLSLNAAAGPPKAPSSVLCNPGHIVRTIRLVQCAQLGMYFHSLILRQDPHRHSGTEALHEMGFGSCRVVTAAPPPHPDLQVCAPHCLLEPLQEDRNLRRTHLHALLRGHCKSSPEEGA